MGDVFQPKALPSKRNTADDAFANVLKGIISGSGTAPGGGDLGSFIKDNFSLPSYTGALSTPETGMQSNAVSYGDRTMDEFFHTGGGGDTVTSALDQILKTPASTMTPEAVYTALDAPRRAGLTRDLGQMEEEFGLGGLAGSTSLAESGARAASESQSALTAQVAQLLPQIETARQGADQNRLAAAQLRGTIPMGMAQAGFNLGEGERQIGDQNLQRLYQEFLRTQGLFPQILAYLSGTPATPYGPSTFQNLTQAGATAAAIAAA